MSYHKLTEKLDNFFLRSDIKDADRIIREYLDGKAVKHQLHSSMLDLEPKGEEKDRCQHGVHGSDCFKCYPITEPVTNDLGDLVKHGQWKCDCGLVLRKASFTFATPGADGHFSENEMKFCPQCGTPRQQEKPLREKVKDGFKKIFPGVDLSDKEWLEIADIAINIIEQEKK